MKIIEGDLLTIEDGIIAHQCNCRGVMGAGIARRIKRRWPQVYKEYRDAYLRKQLTLGDINIVRISENLYIVNLLGQDGYGRGSHKTDYNAVAQAFNSLCKLGNTHNKQIYIPYLMGCANAGGRWDIYSKIVDTYCPGVIAVRLKR